MSTNSRTFQHLKQPIRTPSFHVQYHSGTVLTKTFNCRSAISELLQEPFAVVHLYTHHVGVISHSGSLPTIFQNQNQVACYATVCRLSVTFRYRDHIGWNTSKIISRPNSLRPLLGLTTTWAIWCNGNTPKLGRNLDEVTQDKKLQYFCYFLKRCKIGT